MRLIDRDETDLKCVNYSLPPDYERLSPLRKQDVLRAAILRYLDSVGRANSREVKDAIGAPNQATVTNLLRSMMAKKQIYGEPRGSKEWDFMPNGRLGHPLLQSELELGLTTRFEFRTYDDRLQGKHLCITEYRYGPHREIYSTGGVRVDLAELDTFIQKLQEIKEAYVAVGSQTELVRRR